ncbi:MAG: hypothetical protein EAX96_19400 [Candidatus Lokiarchaeota archaeon]|nr:hypothetical protein [Candidatus Lokiarchaeota archaeon]
MINNDIKIRIAGSGGQGIISAGIIIANAFFLKKFHVLQTESYGAAVRGSTAACNVIISLNPINEINMDEINYLLVMNKTSFEAYISNLIDGGTIILFESLWKEIKHLIKKVKLKVYVLNDMEIIDVIGSALPLSISLIGGFLKLVNLIPLEIVNEVIKNNLSQKNNVINIKALKLGYEKIIKI